MDKTKSVLLISSSIYDINRMRKNFDSSFTIKATSSVQSAAYIAETNAAGLIIYNIGADCAPLFGLYKQLRENKMTIGIPLLIIADPSILKALTDSVDLINGKIIGTTISQENLKKMAYEYFPQAEMR